MTSHIVICMYYNRSGLLRVSDTKQSSADRLWLQMEDSVHCHREKQQGFTSLHSAFLTVTMRLENISTNDNLLDGSTERRLTLAEVEPSNGLYG